MSERDRDPLSFPIVALACALAFVALLDGCATHEATAIHGTGTEAAPPAGWLDFCQRHPKDVMCVPMFRPDGSIR